MTRPKKKNFVSRRAGENLEIVVAGEKRCNHVVRMCVCVRERERMCVCVCVLGCATASLCVCTSMCCMRQFAWKSECACMFVCVGACVCLRLTHRVVTTFITFNDNYIAEKRPLLLLLLRVVEKLADVRGEILRHS